MMNVNLLSCTIKTSSEKDTTIPYNGHIVVIFLTTAILIFLHILPTQRGRGGGLVVSILAFYFDDPSSNPAGYLNLLYEKTKINEKEAGIGTS